MNPAAADVLAAQSLAQHVLWAVFALSVVFGALAQRTHFCTMGAVADIVHIGDWTRMRMWVLAMGTAILGFNAMVGLGWVDASKSLYAAPRLAWGSALAGGAMFGFGMVLASGCGAKTLVRIGGGNLKSLVVFVVVGIAAFATLRGITAVARAATVDRLALALGRPQDLPSLLSPVLGWPKAQLAPALGALCGGGLVAWALARREARSPAALAGGFGIGAVVVGIWWVSGVFGHLAEDPLTLEETFAATASHRMESLSFVAPMAHALDWLMFYSDASKLLTAGVVSAAGVVVGSAAVALATGAFRWEAFGGVGDLAHHLVGAALMGIGGITALGCTIGQGLSGVSTLALGSFVALGAIVAGAVAALRYQAWRMERYA